MSEQKPLLTITYKLADGDKIQIDVSADIADALKKTDNKEKALMKQDNRHIDKYTDIENCDEKMLSPPEKLEDIVERLDEYSRVRVALDSLTETQRKRVEAYFFRGLTYRQIADLENVSVMSVADSIQTAVKKLKNILG